MEPRPHVWEGLDPHLTDGLGIFTLGLCLGPFSAAPGMVRWWSLQQSDLAHTSLLLPAAHGACFPGAVTHCCGASEPSDEENESILGEGSPQCDSAAGQWEFVSLPCSQCRKQFCSPTPTSSLSIAYPGGSHLSKPITKLCRSHWSLERAVPGCSLCSTYGGHCSHLPHQVLLRKFWGNFGCSSLREQHGNEREGKASQVR